VRLKISEGKELNEITEMICDHCLAPDSVDEYSTGSDNMTVMVIALLGSRTKEQWYSWMTDRVRGKYGYDTPTILPRLYSEVRLENFRKSKEHRKDMVQIANPRAAFSTNMSSA
jgi:protein phosphatase 2C family protein 2/3